MPPRGVKRDPRTLRPPSIGQMHPYASTQFVNIDRLGEVINAAAFERMYDMLGLGQPGHENHRHMGKRCHGLEPPAGFKPIQARHHSVHQYHIGRDAHGNVQRCFATAGHQYSDPGLLERLSQETERLRGVVDQQDDVLILLNPAHGSPAQ